MPSPALKGALAFKAFEIEELADVWFFRPAGAALAHLASKTPVTPNQLTWAGLVLGVVSGSALYFPGWGLWGFAGLILHGIVDSADGQLARIRNQFSLEGRLLDGVGGYFTHIAVYLAIALGAWRDGLGPWALTWAVLAGACSAAHAGMYDFHRNQYIQYGIKGEVPKREKVDTSTGLGRFLSAVYGDYESNQQRLARSHAAVQDVLRRKYGEGGRLSEGDREAYRRRFYWMVRGWNFLGDNTRFYAIGVSAWLGRLPLFFGFVLVVMNLAFAALVLLQARADRRCLSDLGEPAA